jgi:DNA polymerase-3 subunit beta
MHFTHQNLSVSGSSVNVGENQSDIETNYEGSEERTIACNAKFLLDMLTRSDCEYVEISMNEELKPIRLRPEGKEEFTYIVMPFKR